MHTSHGPARGRQRMYLTVVIAGSLLGIVLGTIPALRGRLATGAPGKQAALGLNARGETEAPVAPAFDREGPAAPVVDPTAEPAFGSPAGADVQRRAEQLALLQEDLLAREQRWAGQAQALSAPAFSWRRQATAALGTVLLTLGAVAGALKLGLGWSAWQKRLRGEELRLRKLQLSVLGALEELQAAIAQAREDVSAAAPRAAGFTALEAPPAPLHAEYSDPPAEWAERLVGRSVETRPARLAGRPGESRPARPAGRPLEARPTRPAGRSVETRPARPSARPVETRPDRFVARPVELEPARDGGPWMEPPARDAERPVPRPRPAPPWMGRVEELAAEGLTAAEIGRRLRVSREEILLALARRSRERKLDRESGTAEAARIRAAALPQGRGE